MVRASGSPPDRRPAHDALRGLVAGVVAHSRRPRTAAVVAPRGRPGGPAARSSGAAPRASGRTRSLALSFASAYALLSALASQTLTNRDEFFRLFEAFGLLPFAVFAVAPAAFAESRHRDQLLAAAVLLGAYLGLTALFETFGPEALIYPRHTPRPEPRGPFRPGTRALPRGGDERGRALPLRRTLDRRARALAIRTLRAPARTGHCTVVRQRCAVHDAALRLDRRDRRNDRRRADARPCAPGARADARSPRRSPPARRMRRSRAARCTNARRTSRRCGRARISNRAGLNLLETRPLVGVGWVSSSDGPNMGNSSSRRPITRSPASATCCTPVPEQRGRAGAGRRRRRG